MIETITFVCMINFLNLLAITSFLYSEPSFSDVKFRTHQIKRISNSKKELKLIFHYNSSSTEDPDNMSNSVGSSYHQEGNAMYRRTGSESPTPSKCKAII